MKRKTLAALLLSLSVLLTGCAAGQAAQPQEEAQSGTRDSVVIAIGSEPETLDPTQGWGHGNAPIVQSTLVRYTADLTFENDLATDYTLSEDGLVWTLYPPGRRLFHRRGKADGRRRGLHSGGPPRRPRAAWT